MTDFKEGAKRFTLKHEEIMSKKTYHGGLTLKEKYEEALKY